MIVSAPILILAIGAALCATSSGAADRSYLGAWTITSSQVAPWAAPDEKPVPSDLKALIGKTVTFSPDRIAAPRPLDCRQPHYETKAYAPDMLFQGSLTDPVRQAFSLGFAGPKIQTLETGCEGALDFHFAAPAKAMFALNNRIYVMSRAAK